MSWQHLNEFRYTVQCWCWIFLLFSYLKIASLHNIIRWLFVGRSKLKNILGSREKNLPHVAFIIVWRLDKGFTKLVENCSHTMWMTIFVLRHISRDYFVHVILSQSAGFEASYCVLDQFGHGIRDVDIVYYILYSLHHATISNHWLHDYIIGFSSYWWRIRNYETAITHTGVSVVKCTQVVHF